MKFVCLELIRKQDIYPLFLELRDLNDESNPSILGGLTKKINNVTGDFTIEDLHYGLRNGIFFLILDAFDELSFNLRTNMEKEILEISQSFPKCGLIVSGRLNPIFHSWQNFSEARLLPLTEVSVGRLINKLPFDNATKDKFLSILPALYKSHNEFLSNPLLANMMLLTFDHFADIPNKIHVFYEQAFLTLYNMHDAMKAAYKRNTYSNIPLDDFKKVFSAFCFLSCLDESVSFDMDSLKDFSKSAKEIEGVTLDESLWIKDLIESLCLLVVDGDRIVFAHRSFQEYFSALYVVNNAISDMEVIWELLRRASEDDSVIPLAFAINKERIEASYIIPALTEFLNETKDIDIKNDPVSYSKVFFTTFDMDIDGCVDGMHGNNNNSLDILYAILPLYDIRFDLFELIETIDLGQLSKSFNPGQTTAEIRLGPEDNGWLKVTGFAQVLEDIHIKISSLLKTIQNNHNRKNAKLSERIGKR